MTDAHAPSSSGHGLRRIALLSDGILPHLLGGMQAYATALARHLVRRGVEVDVYHALPPGADPSSALCAFTEDERRRMRSFVVPFPEPGRIPGHYVRESKEFSARVLEALDASVDFVYAQGFAGWAALEARRRGQLLPPVGVNLHGLEMFQPAADWRDALGHLLLRPAALANLRGADVVVSYPGPLADLTVRLGVPRDRIVEVPNAVEARWLAPPPAPPPHSPRRFVFVGRHERRKGVPELLTALEVLARERPGRFEMHFVGPIPERLRVGLPGVTYHGAIREEARLRDLLRSMDVLVCPSHSEGLPTVILEAMASGLAVVATDVGSVSVAVSDETGWIVPRARPREIASALRSALDASDDDLARRKRRGPERIREAFLWERAADLTLRGIARHVRRGAEA